MQHEAPALEISNLAASYGTAPVLRNVALKVARGSIVTLIGANGAGKSTLMKVVSGLLAPRNGTIHLYGEDVTGMAPDALVKRGLSLVPESRRLFGAMTIRENLEMGAYARPAGAPIEEDIAQVLDYFPALKDRLSERAGALSGGQQQMVAVARALMARPRLLMLDEPTIGLAPSIVDVIAEIVTNVGRSGVDVLLVEQNAETALAVADYAYILENGSVVSEGSAGLMLQSDEVRKAYLGL